ncbi:MAG TPA: YheU family protein [Pseudohaliea sp.]|nr:YheU family protein [Pseudohaliea sp.]
MASFLRIPPERVPPATLAALLEEYASRDGTDYGQRERSLTEKREALASQLASGELQLLFDTDSESWDLLPREQARRLLGEDA